MLGDVPFHLVETGDPDRLAMIAGGGAADDGEEPADTVGDDVAHRIVERIDLRGAGVEIADH